MKGTKPVDVSHEPSAPPASASATDAFQVGVVHFVGAESLSIELQGVKAQADIVQFEREADETYQQQLHDLDEADRRFTAIINEAVRMLQ